MGNHNSYCYMHEQRQGVDTVRPRQTYNKLMVQITSIHQSFKSQPRVFRLRDKCADSSLILRASLTNSRQRVLSAAKMLGLE